MDRNRLNANKSTALDGRFCLTVGAVGAALLVAACGGGGGGGGGGSNTTPPSTVSTAATPVISCASGSLATAQGSDPLVAAAWHLKNTGPTQQVSAFSNTTAVAGADANVECVHNNGAGYTGQGVTIAVVDSGMEIAHEDLAPNVVAGGSFNINTGSANPTTTPAVGEFDHGSAVSGVLAARGWNGVGSRGVAPRASIQGYNRIGNTGFVFGGGTVSQIDTLILGARGSLLTNNTLISTFGTRADSASVFNMSFGSNPGTPPATLTPSVMSDAATWGALNLRSGRGAVYVQSAGNAYVGNGTSFSLPGFASQAIHCANVFGNGTDIAVTGTFTNRDGLGCGNSNHDPATRNNPYLITAAALNNTNVASSYSNPGANVWVSGFGGEFGNGSTGAAMVTVDTASCAAGMNATGTAFTNFLASLPATPGTQAQRLARFVAESFGISTNLGNVDPNCNYTGQMNGTSSAAPSVAGVVALMLQANPNLTRADVAWILANTATQVDASRAATSILLQGQTNSINLVDGWTQNSAGLRFHTSYGFGRVNAAAAVQQALNFTTPAGRRTNTLSNATAFASAAANTNITAASVLGTGARMNSANVTVGSAATRTGPMQLDVTVTNNAGAGINLNPGQLQFEIVSPNGTKSIVMPAYTVWYRGAQLNGNAGLLADGASRSFRFTTNAFLGETMGNYTVRVINLTPGGGNIALSAGTLTSYSP